MRVSKGAWVTVLENWRGEWHSWLHLCGTGVLGALTWRAVTDDFGNVVEVNRWAARVSLREGWA